MISEHAWKRMQQRSVSPDVLELLDMFAMEGFQKGGTLIQQFPRQEIEQLIKRAKQLIKVLDHAGKTYCVRAANNRVITTGHKTRTLKTVY